MSIAHIAVPSTHSIHGHVLAEDRLLNCLCSRLRMKPIDAASELCTLVFAGDLPLLKRYIAAGIEVH